MSDFKRTFRAVVAVQFILLGAALYVAIHFIRKVW